MGAELRRIKGDAPSLLMKAHRGEKGQVLFFAKMHLSSQNGIT
jgi:hypothetical protein